jgi:tripartite-type tricarboxylate transporter receptor subunit TctC
MAFNSPEFVAVHASLQINTLKELVEHAKRNPGKLEYSSTGVGSYFHLAGEALKKAAGVDILHVPYAQANFPQMVNDWATGRVSMWFPTWATLSPNLSRVKTLAVLDKKRSPHLPDVPTIVELLPGFQPFVVWWGFFGPVGLPTPVATRISAEVRKALQASDVVPKLGDLGLAVVASTPEELASALRQEIDTIGVLVNAIGLKPE